MLPLSYKGNLSLELCQGSREFSRTVYDSMCWLVMELFWRDIVF